MKEIIKAIASIKVELQEKNLNKSGINKYAGFKYFELKDFLPSLNSLMNKHQVIDVFSIVSDKAVLTLYTASESLEYSIPLPDWQNAKLTQQNEIQKLGSVNTYLKRYLYVNAFGISDGDVIDALPQNEQKTKPKTLLTTELFKNVAMWAHGQQKTIADIKDFYTASDEVFKDLAGALDGLSSGLTFLADENIEKAAKKMFDEGKTIKDVEQFFILSKEQKNQLLSLVAELNKSVDHGLTKEEL